MNSNLRNSVYGAFGFIFPVAVFLVTTPYILHKLTPEVYGIYVLAISLSGLMSFLDLGFGQGIIKFVSHYEARGDYERINKIVLTSLVIYTVVGLIGAFVVYLLSDFLVSSVFKLSLNNLAVGSLAFKIVAFGFFVSFISMVFSSILKGLQRYDVTVKIQNSLWFTYVMASILLLYLGKGLVEILIAYVISQVVGVFVYMYASKRLLPKLRFGFGFDRSIFKELFGFSVFVSLNVISGNIVMRLDKMIVSYFLGTSIETGVNIDISYGVLLNNYKVEYISEIVEYLASFSADRLKDMAVRAMEYTHENHNTETYKQDLLKALKTLGVV